MNLNVQKEKWKLKKVKDKHEGYFRFLIMNNASYFESVSIDKEGSLLEQRAKLIEGAPKMYSALDDINKLASFDDNTSIEDLRAQLEQIQEKSRKALPKLV